MGRKVAEPKLFVSFALDRLVPSNHLVRRLAAAVDLSFVHELVRDRYSRTGKPSVDPVVLFKLWLLGYLYNITSERRLCEEASLHLAWRWYLGYELDEDLPDHSVLTKARRRFGPGIYEAFFRQILKLCDERGLVDGGVIFIDSTLSDADAARKSLQPRGMAGHHLPEPTQFFRDLQVVNDEPDEAPEPEPPRPRTNRGRKPQQEPAEPKPTWSTRRALVSTTDPDAELVKRRDGRTRLAHKTQVVNDGGKAGIITAVEVGAAGDSDASAVGRMLDKHRANLGRGARELVGDSGYGTDGAVRECLAREVLPTMKTRSRSRSKDKFGPEAFIHSAEQDVLFCPAGEELGRVREHFVNKLAIYQPVRRGVCASCPLKAHCAPGKGDRQVQRTWDVRLLDQARAHLATPRARRRFRHRGVVSERTMADLKRKHGFDRAQFRGRRNVQIQALLTAAVFNIKELVKVWPRAQEVRTALALPTTTLEALHALMGRFQAAWRTVLGPIPVSRLDLA